MSLANPLIDFITKALSAWKTIENRVSILKTLGATPTTVGVKVADQTELMTALASFFELGDQAHVGPVNGVRSIASIYKKTPVTGTIRFIKLLQRRPGRTDPLGPEHIDLLVPAGTKLDELARKIADAGIKAEVEANDFHSWISVREGNLEFKLVDEVVWQSCIHEMQLVLSGSAKDQ